MKLTKLSKIAGAGIAAFTLANVISIVPASAQTTTTPGTGTGTTTDGTVRTDGTTTTTDYRNDGRSDWGWLGLIGLAGLAGLAGKNRHDHDNVTAYRDPNVRP